MTELTVSMRLHDYSMAAYGCTRLYGYGTVSLYKATLLYGYMTVLRVLSKHRCIFTLAYLLKTLPERIGMYSQ